MYEKEKSETEKGSVYENDYESVWYFQFSDLKLVVPIWIDNLTSKANRKTYFFRYTSSYFYTHSSLMSIHHLTISLQHDTMNV